MSNPPKASRPRYQKIRALARNLAGGRVTYLMRDNATHQLVVIKQFQFAQSGSNWSAFKAYEREIQVLGSLNHPGIPRYLNSFESPAGFCIVQEYKDAQSLAVSHQWTPQKIKKIAICVLEILVYLQNRIPPVIHRDIKPENILVDEQLNVYLVDFGFARIGGGEGAISSVAAGTFGFMAPEQIYNRQLSKATDLYGLGVTLICLLTGTKSTAIETLIDDTGRINFKPLVSQLSRRSIDWLQKMVQPKQEDRYASASEAKEALMPLSFTPVPEVHTSHSSLQFIATKPGEKVTRSITVSNATPKTILKGRWEVAPHPNDPPHKHYHTWISFAPAQFARNQEECRITVDTSKLMADKIYIRQILLQTNSEPKTHTLTVEVHVGSIPLQTFPYASIASLIVSVFLLSIFSITINNTFSSLIAWHISLVKYGLNGIGWNILLATSALIGTIFWLMIGTLVSFFRGLVSSVIAIPASLLLPFIRFRPSSSGIPPNPEGINYSFSAGIFDTILIVIPLSGSFILLGNIVGFLVKEHREAGFSTKVSVQISLLATTLGTILGFHQKDSIMLATIGSREFIIAIIYAIISLLVTPLSIIGGFILLGKILIFLVQERREAGFSAQLSIPSWLTDKSQNSSSRNSLKLLLSKGFKFQNGTNLERLLGKGLKIFVSQSSVLISLLATALGTGLEFHQNPLVMLAVAGSSGLLAAIISIPISLLATALGSSLGFYQNPFVGLAAGTSGLLAAMIFYTLWQRQKLIDEYRQSEPHRIKP